MNKDTTLSKEMLQAFVDQQFSSDERREILQQLQQDKALADEVCELQRLKSLVKEAYLEPPQARPRQPAQPGNFKNLTLVAAAVLIFMLGALSHMLFHSGVGLESFKLAEHSNAAQQDSRVLVHISSNNLQNSRNTLFEIANLLRDYDKEGRQIKVQVVANGSGLEMLSLDSPVGDLIINLMRNHDNIEFSACNNTIKSLQQEKSQTLALLPGVQVIDSGVVKVIQLQQQGWSYIRS